MKDGTYWYVGRDYNKNDLGIFRLTVKGDRANWAHHEDDYPFANSWASQHIAYSNYWDAWAELCRMKQRY